MADPHGDRHVKLASHRRAICRYRARLAVLVDYDDRLHARYLEGSRMPPDVSAVWVDAFRRWLPHRRPLRLADVGSGAGRFTSSLADVFGGFAVGIEVSVRMRAMARAALPHPKVQLVGGACEAIPMVDHAVDGALLFGVWHHLRDSATSAAELARVVRPDGTLLVRTTPSDRLARPWWDEWLPEVYDTDRALLPALAQTTATMSSAGWQLVAVDEVAVPPVLTRRQDLERLQHRSLSTLEYLDDRVVDEGIVRIASALAIHPDADQPAPVAPQDLLVFTHR